jgi:uncharacterized protein DUF6582
MCAAYAIDRSVAGLTAQRASCPSPGGRGGRAWIVQRREQKEVDRLMPELRTVEQRKRVPKEKFAYVDKRGEGHLPIEDESHIRNAMARFNQTKFPSVTVKESARRKILAAARRHEIEISPDDKIRKRAASLRPARTKRGPRGGRLSVKPKRPTSRRQTAAARRNITKARRARLRKVRARKG